MERIVRQEIPAVAVDNRTWMVPADQPGQAAAGRQGERSAALAREADVKVRRWLTTSSVPPADPTRRTAPTGSERRLRSRQADPGEGRRGRCWSPSFPPGSRTCRPGQPASRRPLSRFDIWYSGFKSAGRSEPSSTPRAARLPRPPARSEPTCRASSRLFTEKAAWLSRGSVATRLGLRPRDGAVAPRATKRTATRVGRRMDYKGYNMRSTSSGHKSSRSSASTGSTTVLPACPTGLHRGFPSRSSPGLELLPERRRGREGRHHRARHPVGRSRWRGLAVDLHAWRWLYAHPDATGGASGGGVAAPATSGTATSRGHRLRDSEILGGLLRKVNAPLYLSLRDRPHHRLPARRLAARELRREFERMASRHADPEGFGCRGGRCTDSRRRCSTLAGRPGSDVVRRAG